MPAPKRIVITGVSRGPGRALVDGFVARGHVVSGCARSTEAIGELQARYPSPNGFRVVDVTHDFDVRAWAKRVLKGGPPDLLVNNAATINRNAPLWKVPAEEFSRVIDVNVKGVSSAIGRIASSLAASNAAPNTICVCRNTAASTQAETNQAVRKVQVPFGHYLYRTATGRRD
ncbi:MAG: SDR family oxidoreductase [Thermoguttaceae bacterium]|jgi:NAD(P)-dependent dehydrogenase (short-subunit alcohol dehydrogenase family)